MDSFKEQAITTSSYKPRMWNRYVDGTFSILDRGNVDSFLQELYNYQPSIGFNMETKSDSKLLFPDTAVSRESDDRNRVLLIHCGFTLCKRSFRATTSLPTLRSHLVRLKDTVDSTKQDGVVYRIPCECGKFTSARLEDLCRTGPRSTNEKSDSPVPRP